MRQLIKEQAKEIKPSELAKLIFRKFKMLSEDSPALVAISNPENVLNSLR